MTAQDTITAVHANVYCALAAAQAEFSAPIKGSTNPAFRSKYADLANVVEAVAPALSRHGIAFVHYTAPVDLGDGPRQCMVTALVHGASDTRMECAIPLLLGKMDMQGFKSATTYAKRIGLESVTGVAPDDDDGNDAAKNPPTTRKATNTGPNPLEIACTSLRKADTLDALRSIWSDLPKPIQSSPEAIRAKDERKTALEQPKAETPLAEQLDDAIPY